MTALSITVVDIVAGLVILVSAILATWRGLMRETLSIFSWVIAAYATLVLFPVFRPMVRGYISPPLLADLADAAGLFIIALVPLSFLSFRLAERVKSSEIGPVDRALGFVFGVGRGLIVLGVVHIVFGYLVPAGNDPTWLTQARVYPLMQKTGVLLRSLVPNEHIGAPVVETAEPAKPTPRPPVDAKTYGASERRTLDRLIQATGAAKDSPQ